MRHRRVARQAGGNQTDPAEAVAARLAALRHVALFSAWPAPVLAGLAQASHMVAVAAGTTVMRLGHIVDAIYVLASGAVSIGATDPQGRRMTLKIDSPGEHYGLLAWAASGVMKRHDVVAMESSRFVVIPAKEFDQALKAAPELWRSIAVEASQRLGLAIDMALGMGLESLQVRFAKQILRKVGTLDAPASAGQAEVRMSQHTMSELLGVSRQTVTALAAEFRQRGLIQWQYGRILVLNLEGLRQASNPAWRPVS